MHHIARPPKRRAIADASVFVVVMLAATSVFAEGPFAIAPFLYADPQAGVTLAWSYADPSDEIAPTEVQAPVTFTDDAGRSHVVVPTFKDGVYRAAPPTFCGTSRWTYFVPKMNKPERAMALPCPGAPSVTFSFVTDTQLDLDETVPLVKKMAERDDAFTIHGGDIVDLGGFTSLWELFFDAANPLTRNRPLVASAGNHDFFFDQAGENVERFLGMTEAHRFYRFRSGPVLVVVLDSTHVNDAEFSAKQQAFLKRALDDDSQWKIVLFHHALYTESFAHGFVANFREFPHRKLIAEYEPIFIAHGVDLVVTGHVHLLERSYKDGVQYLVGGPAGGLMGIRTVDNPYGQLSIPVRSATAFSATETKLTFDSFDKEGTAFDHYVLTKGGQSTAESPSPAECSPSESPAESKGGTCAN